MDPKEDFESPRFEKNSENFEKSRKSRNLAREIFTMTPGEVKFSSIFTSGGVFFRNFHLGGCFFPKFSPRGGVFFLNFHLGGVFSEKWPKITQPRARAKSPNLSPFGLKFSGQDNPLGGTVVDSQKYLESRKSAGWWSSRGYAVYLDLESRDSMFSKYFWESTTGFPRQVLRMIPAPPQTPWGGGGPRFFHFGGAGGDFFFFIFM